MSTYEELLIKKESIDNMQQNYIIELLNMIKIYEEEIQVYKRKIQNDSDYIKLLERKVNDLENSKPIVVEDRGINYTENNLHSKNDKLKKVDKKANEYIEVLKDSFIKGSKFMPSLLINSIPKLGMSIYKLNDEDLFFLICASYVNNNLKKICSKSVTIDRALEKNTRFKEVIKTLEEENKKKILKTTDKCFRDYFKENMDVFNILEEPLRGKVIKEIESKAFLIFKEAKDINKCVRKPYAIGWIKSNIEDNWMLVNAPYDKASGTIYLEKDIMDKLGYKVDVKESVKIEKSESNNNSEVKIKSILKDISLIEEDFISKTSIKIKEVLKSKKLRNEQLALINIAEDLEYVGEAILKSDGYSLLIISVFYGVFDVVIKKSSFLNFLYNSPCATSKLIRTLKDDLNYDSTKGINIPAKKFYFKYRENFVNVNKNILSTLDIKINDIFKDTCEKVFKAEMLDKCPNDFTILGNKEIYVKLQNRDNSFKYIRSHISSCRTCNIGYVMEKRINLINTQVSGYTLVYEDNKSKGIYKENEENSLEIKDIYEGKALNEESELRKMGYSISLSRSERLDILKRRAIPRLGKRKVENHIRWLIKMSEKREDRKNAMSEWQHDLDTIMRL